MLPSLNLSRGCKWKRTRSLNDFYFFNVRKGFLQCHIIKLQRIIIANCDIESIFDITKRFCSFNFVRWIICGPHATHLLRIWVFAVIPSVLATKRMAHVLKSCLDPRLQMFHHNVVVLWSRYLAVILHVTCLSNRVTLLSLYGCANNKRINMATLIQAKPTASDHA